MNDGALLWEDEAARPSGIGASTMLFILQLLARTLKSEANIGRRYVIYGQTVGGFSMGLDH